MVEETIPTKSEIEGSTPMRNIGRRVATQPSSLDQSFKRHGVGSEEERVVNNSETWWDVVLVGTVE